MPSSASEALTLALADACHDPLGVTQPYGEEDDVMRVIVTESAFAVPSRNGTSERSPAGERTRSWFRTAAPPMRRPPLPAHGTWSPGRRRDRSRRCRCA